MSDSKTPAFDLDITGLPNYLCENCGAIDAESGQSECLCCELEVVKTKLTAADQTIEILRQENGMQHTQLVAADQRTAEAVRKMVDMAYNRGLG